MRKKLHSLFCLLFLLSELSFSQTISLNEAQTIAKNQLLKVSTSTLKSAKLKREDIRFKTAKTEVENKDTLFYILNDSVNNAFMIVSADQRAWPVLGYSTEGTFDENSQPEAFKAWMEGRRKEIAYIKANNLEADEQTTEQWNQLKSANLVSQTNGVEPLLKTKWNQWPYYNDLCPVVNGIRTPTGCVATALAQIMKYWNYPTRGIGSHSYQRPNPIYGAISADFGSTTYQWAQMPNELTGPNDAVATLMYHIGVATDMWYSNVVSSPASDEVLRIQKYFDYSSSAERISSDEYSTSDWANILRSELDHARPVYYTKVGDPGHAFVCDGYQESDYFHFNWGWGGGADGYYYIGNLNPYGNNFTGGGALIKITPNRLPDGYQGIFLSNNSVDLGPDEGYTPSINVTVASSAKWTASSDQSWLSISVSNGVAGTSTLTLTSTENKTNSTRTAIVTITADGFPKQTITIKQYHYIETTAGNLRNVISNDLATSSILILKGTIDARDFKTMRDMMPLLSKLNLSNVTINEYTGTEGTSGNNSTVYPANTIPDFALQQKIILKSIKLPNSLTAVGKSAFNDCRGINSIVLPTSVTSIGSEAFYNCRSLANVTFSPSLSSIGNNAFSYCDHLFPGTIPSTVKYIGSSPFANIKGLITVDPNNSNYSSIDGVLYNKNQTRLIQCPSSIRGSLLMPKTVKTIGTNAFLGDIYVTSVPFPAGLDSIELNAFCNCARLKTISFPSSIKYIGSGAFYYCISVDTIISKSRIPVDLANTPGVFNNLKKDKVILMVPAGSKASYQAADQWKDFANIVEMPGLYLSMNIEEIAASKCTKLISFFSSSSWDAKSNQAWLTLNSATGQPGKSTLLLNASENSTSSIRSAQVTISAVGFEDQIITVNQSARITVTAGTLQNTLSETLALTTNLSLSGTIDARDFKTMRDKMPLLTQLDLTDVKIVEYTGTEGTEGMNNITYPANAIPACAFLSPNTWIPNTKLESLILPTSITSIGVSAFRDCKKLNLSVIPASVKSIGYGAFLSISGPLHVDLNNSEYSSQNGILYNKDKTILLFGPSSISGILDIPNSVEKIEFQAFQDNKYITDIRIPSALKRIRSFAFWRCSGVKKIILPSNLEYIGAFAFENCINVDTIISFAAKPLDFTKAIDPCCAPPTAIFSGINKETTILMVPAGTKSIYKSLEQWKDFQNIVEMPNQAPTATATTDQTVDAGSTVTLDGSLSADPEGQLLTYLWTPPAGISLSSVTSAKPTFVAPEVTTNQKYTFSLVVSDGTVSSAPAQIVVTVRRVNKAPLANAGVDQAIDEGSKVTLDGSLSADPDGQSLTYMWTAPSGISLSSTTSAKPTFVAPEVATNQKYTFSLVVSDGTASSAPAQIVVTVRQVNKAPLANAGVDQSVDEGSTVILDGSLSADPDGQSLTYLWTAPAGISLSSVTAAKPTFVAPEVATNQKYTFSLVVSDGTVSSTPAQIGVTVRQVNKAPLAMAGADQAIDEGSTVTLNGSLSADPDGQSLTYLWTAPAGISLSSATSAKPTFVAPEVSANQKYTFSLVVSDGTISSTPAQIVVTVRQVNKAPLAKAGADQAIDEGSTVTLDGSLSADPDGQSLTYLWTAPPGISLNSATSATPTFVAPEVNTDTKFSFTLVVNDGLSNSLIDQVDITVKQVIKVGVDLLESADIKIFPNPTSGKINLEVFGKTGQSVQVNIYNLQGQEIFCESNFDSYSQIDITHYDDGVYLVKITTEDKTYTATVIHRK